MDLPNRRLTDPLAMRALAHPLRIAMLQSLRLRGPATATILAVELSATPPATSYHLRQLERFGFIAAAPRRGNKKERWWRAVDAAKAPPIDDRSAPELASLRAELELAPGPPRWRRHCGVHLTVGEAAELAAELRAIMERYASRNHQGPRPIGSRPYNLATILVPFDAGRRRGR